MSIRATNAYVSLCEASGLDLDSSTCPLMSVAGSRSVCCLFPTMPRSACTSNLGGPTLMSLLTTHGFRARCMITLLILDCTPEEVKTHCWCASKHVYAHRHGFETWQLPARALRRWILRPLSMRRWLLASGIGCGLAVRARR